VTAKKERSKSSKSIGAEEEAKAPKEKKEEIHQVKKKKSTSLMFKSNHSEIDMNEFLKQISFLLEENQALVFNILAQHCEIIKVIKKDASGREAKKADGIKLKDDSLRDISQCVEREGKLDTAAYKDFLAKTPDRKTDKGVSPARRDPKQMTNAIRKLNSEMNKDAKPLSEIVQIIISSVVEDFQQVKMEDLKEGEESSCLSDEFSQHGFELNLHLLSHLFKTYPSTCVLLTSSKIKTNDQQIPMIDFILRKISNLTFHFFEDDIDSSLTQRQRLSE